MTAGSTVWSIVSRALRARRFLRRIRAPRSSLPSPGMKLALIGRWHSPPGISPMRRTNASSASRWPISLPSCGQRRPTRHCDVVRRFRLVWPVIPRHSCARRIRRMESSYDRPEALLDWSELRTKLHLNPEPPIDPESVEIDQLHLSRLASVPIDAPGRRPPGGNLSPGCEMGPAAREEPGGPVDRQRPSLMTTGRIEMIDLYGDLAVEAAHDGDRSAAEEWIVRGRQAESPKKRSANALAWEMIGLEVKMLLDEPDVWVPVLAVILERCRGNNEATSAVLLRLVSLGLVQAGVDPKRPDQLILDTQMLEQYLKRFGPRVTTATGELGVAASQSRDLDPGIDRGPLGDLDSGLRRLPSPRESRSSFCRDSKTLGLAVGHIASGSASGLASTALGSNRSDQSLRSNRYSHFIFAICRPDTARHRKILVGGEPSEHDVLSMAREKAPGGLLRLTRKRTRGCNEHGGEGVRSEATSRSRGHCKRGDHIVRSPGLIDLR